VIEAVPSSFRLVAGGAQLMPYRGATSLRTKACRALRLPVPESLSEGSVLFDEFLCFYPIQREERK
jgi:hypothetical protein